MKFGNFYAMLSSAFPETMSTQLMRIRRKSRSGTSLLASHMEQL